MKLLCFHQIYVCVSQCKFCSFCLLSGWRCMTFPFNNSSRSPMCYNLYYLTVMIWQIIPNWNELLLLGVGVLGHMLNLTWKFRASTTCGNCVEALIATSKRGYHCNKAIYWWILKVLAVKTFRVANYFRLEILKRISHGKRKGIGISI